LIDAPSKGIVWKFEGDLVSTQAIIFIGHGRAKDWLELKEFLKERLNVACVFNSESADGLPSQQRLEDMLRHATFSFLVLKTSMRMGGLMHAKTSYMKPVCSRASSGSAKQSCWSKMNAKDPPTSMD
jgi:hypothetical protein